MIGRCPMIPKRPLPTAQYAQRISSPSPTSEGSSSYAHPLSARLVPNCFWQSHLASLGAHLDRKTHRRSILKSPRPQALAVPSTKAEPAWPQLSPALYTEI